MNYTIAEISASLEASYAHLRQCMEFVSEWTGTVNESHRELAVAKQTIILANAADPKALGANEAARNATLEDLTRDQREILLTNEKILASHRHQLELARLEVEHWRAQLRCVEAFVATGEIEGAYGLVLKV